MTEQEAQIQKDNSLIELFDDYGYNDHIWCKRFRDFMSCDFSGTHNNEFINNLFKICMKLIFGYIKVISRESYAGTFKLVCWSLIKNVTDQIINKVSDQLKIKIIPYIFRDLLVVEVKVGERIKRYKFEYNRGYEELSLEKFQELENSHPDNNDNDFVRYIPFTLMRIEV